MNSTTIIRICRYTLSNGHRCQGPSVRGRSCCRHHLTARSRLHNMARARRLTHIPRLRFAVSARDMALNHAEVARVIATGRIDPDTARTMRWAMQLISSFFRAEQRLARQNCTPKPNDFYHVPLSHEYSNVCSQNPLQVLENTDSEGRGATANLDLVVLGRSYRLPNHKSIAMMGL